MNLQLHSVPPTPHQEHHRDVPLDEDPLPPKLDPQPPNPPLPETPDDEGGRPQRPSLH